MASKKEKAIAIVFSMLLVLHLCYIVSALGYYYICRKAFSDTLIGMPRAIVEIFYLLTNQRI